MKEEKATAIHHFPKFFVGKDCLSCGACWKEAPASFTSHDLDAYAYVYKQPETEAEVAACNSALKICPINIIGSIHE